MGEVKEKGGRSQWDNQIEFILACVGYAVGIGNVWRFPYLCYKNGGSAFLIPYVVSLFVAGIPIFYYELIIGQFSSLGPIGVFKRMVPISQGIGWGMAITSFLTQIYYNMILAWILLYFFLSFRTDLLWGGCRHDWNTQYCHSNLETKACTIELKDENATFFNKQCYNSSAFAAIEETYNTVLNGTKKSPSEEFLENYVLNQSDGIEEVGTLQWRLVVALAVAWVIVFFCLIKGVQSTGKVVYFTATFPYVVLIALLVRGVTLEGAYDGIKFYIVDVDFDKLTEIEVWKDAAIQIFYSLGPAFGGLLTMASYNKFENNCYRDALFVSLTNCCTSVFAGFAVFSIAGFMSRDLGVPVKSVVRDGIGLAFIAYPEAIVRMPGSPIWAVLFFFMLLTLGLDSQFAMTETVTTALQDQWPKLRKHTSLVCFLVCIISFCAGLPMCTNGGIYFFTLMNNYAAGWNLMCLAFLELIVAMWIYGIRNFILDVKLMLGEPRHCLGRLIGTTGLYFKITWLILTPLFLLAIIGMSFYFHGSSVYGSYVFPAYAEWAGWALSAISILCVILFALYRISSTCCGEQKCSSLFKKSVEWCPAHERDDRIRQSYGGTVKPPYTVSYDNPLAYGNGNPYSTGVRSHTVRPTSYQPAYGYMGQTDAGLYGTLPYYPHSAYGQRASYNAHMNGAYMNMPQGYYHSQTLPYGQQYPIYGSGMELGQMNGMGTYGGNRPYYRPPGKAQNKNKE